MNSLVGKCRGLRGTGDDATNANAIPPVPFPHGRGCRWFRHPFCARELAHWRAQHCEKMGTGLGNEHSDDKLIANSDRAMEGINDVKEG
jgi:hypothetical protein